MHIVLVHTDTRGFELLREAYPPSLLPLFDKPLIQQVIETAYESGYRELVLIANDRLDLIARTCGTGERYGVKLDVRFGAHGGDETTSLRKHRSVLAQRSLVLPGICWVSANLNGLENEHKAHGRLATILREAQTGMVIGAVLEPGAARWLDDGVGPLVSRFEAWLEERPDETHVVEIDDACHRVATGADLLAANQRLLRQPDTLVFTSHVSETPGVYIGRGVAIHPDARIRPPALIGDFSQVLAGAEVGPDVVLGKRTVVGRKAKVSRAIVTEGSYFGELTKVDHAIVVHHRLFGLDTNTRALVTDPFLLGQTNGVPVGDSLQHLLERGIAAGLLAAFAPAALVAGLRSRQRQGSMLASEEILNKGEIDSLDDLVYLPRTRVYRFAKGSGLSWYPALWSVVRGKMRLVGNRPLTEGEAQHELEDRHTLRFKVRPGILGVTDVDELDPEAGHLAETFYAERRTGGLDARILLACVVRPLLGRQRARQIVGI